MDETSLTEHDLERFWAEGEPTVVENLATPGSVAFPRLRWSSVAFHDNRAAKAPVIAAKDVVPPALDRSQT
jgi:hypothetical protein